jgi:FlaA1/EpsC-like NDP-sugar epimerase
VACLGDVTDAARVRQIFAEYDPQVAVHAAAHKHVPMMVEHPGEAVKNNVGGTQVVADVAAEHRVERFVLVSTDKAVNPMSVMWATKRITERYIQHVAATTGLNFVAVRFGNVLGSTGSVIPIFKQQVEAGAPVTVTHPDMVRCLMTIPEASGLVL